MKIRLRKIAFVAIALSIIASCSKGIGDAPVHIERATNSKANTTGKYLKFKTKEDFALYLQEVKRGGNHLRALKMYAQYTPKGFQTISELKAQAEGLRSMSASTRVQHEETLVDTEMTKEEFDLFRAEELLVDPSLSLVLDTTLRVEVGEELYAVTEVGTFVASTQKEEALNQAIREARLVAQSSSLIEPAVPITTYTHSEARSWKESNYTRFTEISDMIQESQHAEEVNLTPDVRFINTYTPSNSSISRYNEGSLNTESHLPELHKPYDVNTYRWEEKTVLGKVLGWVSGSHNIGRENYFDSKHRAQLYIYDLNLGFVTVTGIKARKQYRRKFLFVNIWKPTESEKMVVGFNHLIAEATNNVKPQSTIPFAMNTVNSLEAYVNGQLTNFVSRAYSNIEFIEDWSRNLSTLVPIVNIPYIDFRLDPVKAFDYIYNAPKEQIISMLHHSASKWAYNPLRKRASKEMPRAGFFPDGDRKTKIYALGVEEYDYIGTKTITLNFSAGLTFSSDLKGFRLLPFIPRDVELKSFDVFVAIKHGGKWKGVRMTY